MINEDILPGNSCGGICLGDSYDQVLEFPVWKVHRGEFVQGRVDFETEGLLASFSPGTHKVDALFVTMGYQGTLPDGTKIGDSIADIEKRGWSLDLSEEGWINPLFADTVIQSKYDDPVLDDESVGNVELIMLFANSRK
jgi:hypothetical protein